MLICIVYLHNNFGTRNEHSTPLEGIKVMGREGKKGLRDWLRIHRLGKGRVK